MKELLGRSLGLGLHIMRIAWNFLITRRSTYCHMLWDSVFISNKGDVYTCCGLRPGKVGNIYKRPLTSIWSHGLRLKFYRYLSAHNALGCFFNCDILTSSEKQRQKGLPELSHPKRVWMLSGELCNLACTMCPQDHRSPVILDNRILQQSVEWSKVEEVGMQGGEILAIKQAKEMYLWLTRELNKKVNLITNGVLIDHEWALNLVRGADWIQVSVNAATKGTHETININSNFEKVIDNVRLLVRLKREHALPVEIVYKFTMVPENLQEISAAIRLADALGCDSIAFGFDPSVAIYLSAQGPVAAKLREEIAAVLAGGYRICVEKERLEILGLV